MRGGGCNREQAGGAHIMLIVSIPSNAGWWLQLLDPHDVLQRFFVVSIPSNAGWWLQLAVT